MDEHFFIGDKKLISLLSASRLVPYSKEYIARLARDAKIAALQVNRQWFIDPASLQSFFDHAQLELQARAAHVRASRKNDLDLHTWWNAFLEHQAHRRSRREARVATKTVIVIIVGLLVGLVVTAANATPVGVGQLATLPFFTQPAAVVTPVYDRDQTVLWYEAGSVITVTEPLSIESGIVLFNATNTDATSTTEDFFSDPVTITEISSTTGYITSPSGQQLPYVSIPEINRTDGVSP